MPFRPKLAVVCGLSLLAVFAGAPMVVHETAFRTAMGDLVPLVVLGAATYFSLRNTLDSQRHTRLFWGLMTASLAMWCFNLGCWAVYEVILRRPISDPFPGDIVLFLHIVPMMAAVALRPSDLDGNDGRLLNTLNVLILLGWWIVVYAFFVFPDEYLVTNIPVYTMRWDLLYLVEGMLLLGLSASAYFGSSGPWRKLYACIFAGSFLYTLASEAMNAAIARGAYQTGGVYDIPFLAALLTFLAVTLVGRQLSADKAIMPAVAKRSGLVIPMFAQLALLSLPVLGYAALFLSHDSLYLRQVRFGVAMGGVAVLALFLFLKQYLLDQRLVELLNRSRQSFDNLERLQGRAILQAKLASLGELVALAASELEYPLAAILESSDHMAASGNLTMEQLANAQKIGQQARRTRELVNDLLSFAQQTPGEKIPLELKPLLQRAVQMEGFKLENRNISLLVENMDAVPRVLGNSNQLLQAFVQIVENAVDALQEIGGGKLQIAVWREAEDVIVQFADSGPGLQNPGRVFDPFYTTKPVGKGTGLGLSATYGVVQDHKGQITCFNRPEGGAVFEIRLPAFKPGAAAAAMA
ncbi:MAG TPA: HAMP domain-containing sensor histidine kinase [Bryobacteraceae bacterium]|nr:HAMP domain-containing sensor histidine kinase [Bryobacteraceae bacterium]